MKMSKRSEICRLVVTNDRKEGYVFLFQAVDGEVLFGYEFKTCIAGKMTMNEFATISLTVENARKVARLLGDMVVEACEQEEKSK